jgi:uncharacterized protein (DUF433 family)
MVTNSEEINSQEEYVMTQLAQKLKYPYISRDKNIRQGQPVISGTGIRVLDIVVRYALMDMTPEDILISFPHLTLSQIHDALSFYYDHKVALDNEWKTAVKEADLARRSHPSLLEEKIGQAKDLHG